MTEYKTRRDEILDELEALEPPEAQADLAATLRADLPYLRRLNTLLAELDVIDGRPPIETTAIDLGRRPDRALSRSAGAAAARGPGRGSVPGHGRAKGRRQ